ncbi:MAG: phosphopentomutase [Bryobacteraceae bacterium]
MRARLLAKIRQRATGRWQASFSKRHFRFSQRLPHSLMRDFEQRAGRESLGNRAASGTEIIAELGDEHVRTGKLIVYTSADSVFQIAAHEEIVPLAELYRICQAARQLLSGDFEVARVIARPFTGGPGNYKRTANRHDYAVPPPAGMLLDRLEVPVHAVGKISDVFLGRGISKSDKTVSNLDGMAKTLDAMRQTSHGLIFVNLVDFDMLYGHRNDVEGYANALEEVDRWLPSLLETSESGDLLILTADHGCDPTTPGTDHSREYVPLLVRGGAAVNLGTRTSLADIGQTVAENFGTSIQTGQSFLDLLQPTIH